MTSLLITHFLTPCRLGRSYITSSMTSSRILRKPRAPVLRPCALVGSVALVMRCLFCPPGESSSGQVIGGKPCVAYGQCEKRDQAAAISIGHHAAMRQVVHRLPVESAQSRRDDARARPVRRSFHDSPLDRQAGSGAGEAMSPVIAVGTISDVLQYQMSKT